MAAPQGAGVALDRLELVDISVRCGRVTSLPNPDLEVGSHVQTSDPAREAVELLVRRYVTAYNSFDIEGMLALMASDICFANYSGGTRTVSVRGVAAFRALAEESARLFAEREQHIRRLRCDRTTAVAEIRYRGRPAEDLPGGPVAGTVIELDGRSEFVIRDGLIAELTDYS